MADTNDPLKRELDEEVRREQMLELWERYGVYVLGTAAAILVGVMGYSLWEGQTRAAAQAAGAQYAAALALEDGGKPVEALKAFADIADHGPAGYAALARLQLAAAQMKAGKDAEALNSYEALAKDTTADLTIRDLAKLRIAQVKLSTADWPEMQNRLSDLTGDANPWRSSARELLGLAALKAQKLAEARSAFQTLLTDPKVPRQMSERARIAMSTVIAQEFAKKAKVDAKPDASKPDAKTDAKPVATPASVGAQPAASPTAGAASGVEPKK